MKARLMKNTHIKTPQQLASVTAIAKEREFWDDVSQKCIGNIDEIYDGIYPNTKNLNCSASETTLPKKHCGTASGHNHSHIPNTTTHFQGKSLLTPYAYNNRITKFTQFLCKHGQLKGKKPHNIRSEILYGHAKVQSVLKEEMKNKIESKRIEDEQLQCTFNPTLNKRSKSMAQINEEDACTIYQRGMQWTQLKMEKIYHNRTMKLTDREEECTYRPMLYEPLNYLNKPKSRSMYHEQSTTSFIERQQCARKIRNNIEELKTVRCLSISNINTSAINNTNAHNNSQYKMKNQTIDKNGLVKIKLQLRKELANSKQDNTSQ